MSSRWSFRWWEVAPEIALAAGLAYFFVDENAAATSAFHSGRAVLLMAATAVAWATMRLLAARFVRLPVLRMAPFVASAAVVLAVVVAPAYRTHTVVETLRGDVASGPEVEAVDSATPTTGATPTTAAAPPRPVLTGALRGIDHRARGSVAVYRRGDGRFVIGLEDFDIQPGPDYDLYVVTGRDRSDLDGATRIDDLRGNAGTQYYDAPPALDLGAGDWTVLVWCQTFGVPVAHATPTASLVSR